MERHGVKPDVISYSSLASAYGNATVVDTAAAEDVLNRLEAKGYLVRYPNWEALQADLGRGREIKN